MSKTAANDVRTEARGLTIERRFTSPDAHPFEQVEWELRDAVIGDPDRPAFEQREVEFPSTWSQNATNIVAQKYFRGQLGTPQRERSVKQMISRVAGRIARAGREAGYFASAEDAEAFEDELTHILLHQKAAFNSPVWFNVGWRKPGEEQASACQPYHALVSTPEGMVPIGEIVANEQIGREVYDAGGVTRVVAVKENGRKPVRRVRLRNGSFIEATPDHVVKAAPGFREKPGWLRVDQLEPGMRLHLHPHRAKVAERAMVTAGGPAWSEFPDGLDYLEAVDESTRVERAEAALAGWLQADGFVGQYAEGTNRSLTIEFQVANDDEYIWVMENLDVVFPEVHRKVREADTQETRVRRIRLYGEVLRRFVDEWELLPRGTEIRVPSRLRTASYEEIIAYLRSVFQADGYVSYRRQRNGYENGFIGFAVIGERWTEDLQLMLGTLGIYSRRLRKRERRRDRHDLHELRIGIGSERARFAELVGFIGQDKQRKLLESLELRGLKQCADVRPEEIVAIEDIGIADVYDIQTESGEYLTNNIAVHNCFILSVEDSMESILDWNTQEGIIFKGGSGSGINLSRIRGSMEPLSKGGIASGPVSFMRGADSWAGAIKSGGGTRRAAKMVVLDVDHPDVEDFIWCKAREEEKAAALRDAGFDMRLDSEAFASVQYQNANNSVRVSDEFMEAVANDDDWQLTARTDGSVIKTVKARELMNQIADAAWRCADPGVQYDTMINRWHTCPQSGRINASNPCCFVGETLVQTAEGQVSFNELYERSASGAELPFTHSFAGGTAQMGRISTVWVAGMTDELVEVGTESGSTLRCTPEHRFLTSSGDYVEARALTAGTKLRAIAEARLPASVGPGEPTPDVTPRATEREVTVVREVKLDAPVPVFDLEVPGFHNFVVTTEDVHVDGVVVHNSEYMHVDDSACNLASLNLMKFRNADGTFNVEDFCHAVDVTFLAQEIIVGFSSYPTEQIGRNARAFRQLGLGYANLGALLMSDGIPYDSEEGRNAAAAITALMTGRAYRHSAEIAAAIGPYDEYARNREPHNRVMRMHRDASYEIDGHGIKGDLLHAARTTWDEAVEVGEEHGYRNAQATVLAPTGTISFLMDCDTTGLEPDFSLVKYKELVGGGQMTIVNSTVPMALETLGYSEQEIEQIEAYINEKGTIIGAPGLKDEHLPVFDVAVGERAISHMGHIKMMAAIQPGISGALSKTVNLPESATVEDIAEAFMQGAKLGLKALAIYRDGSKTAQALRTEASEEQGQAVAGGSAEPAGEASEARPVRRKMPRERESLTHKFSIAGHEGYITAGKYEDGSVGEIFLTDVGKEGSTLRGMMNAFATAISIGLQYGVPLEVFVKKFSYMRFDPEGITQNPEIPFAKSMPDYIMRWLASRFIDDLDELEGLGILTDEVRARKQAQQALFDGQGEEPGNGHSNGQSAGEGDSAEPPHGGSAPPTAAMTDTPPVVPAKLAGPDLGPACEQCGGMMQRTGSCYTCSSCGNNTGCG